MPEKKKTKKKTKTTKKGKGKKSEVNDVDAFLRSLNKDLNLENKVKATPISSGRPSTQSSTITDVDYEEVSVNSGPTEMNDQPPASMSDTHPVLANGSNGFVYAPNKAMERIMGLINTFDDIQTGIQAYVESQTEPETQEESYVEQEEEFVRPEPKTFLEKMAYATGIKQAVMTKVTKDVTKTRMVTIQKDYTLDDLSNMISDVFKQVDLLNGELDQCNTELDDAIKKLGEITDLYHDRFFDLTQFFDGENVNYKKFTSKIKDTQKLVDTVNKNTKQYRDLNKALNKLSYLMDLTNENLIVCKKKMSLNDQTQKALESHKQSLTHIRTTGRDVYNDINEQVERVKQVSIISEPAYKVGNLIALLAQKMIKGVQHTAVLAKSLRQAHLAITEMTPCASPVPYATDSQLEQQIGKTKQIIYDRAKSSKEDMEKDIYRKK